MRSPVENDYDQKCLDKLNAKEWQIKLLDLNPEYPHWGPYEDYMCDSGKKGWRDPLFFSSWEEFKFELDELNECVHFYFELERSAVDCESCDATGYNPETRQISDDFFDFNRTGRRWSDKITQDEVEALQEANRLNVFVDGKWQKKEGLTAEEVNVANGSRATPMSKFYHDGINRFILIETRAKRLGVYGLCPKCDGEGSIYTEDKAHVNLVLWILHPRKGASRGIEIKNIQKSDLPQVFAWLREAAQRNADRFSKIVNL